MDEIVDPLPNQSPYTLMIADVHLQPDAKHPINQAFESFLDTHTKHAERLYILGDLFEIWLGDDIGLENYAPIIKRLKQLSDTGMPIYVMYGNRDFLMRDAFVNATGVHLLNDIEVVELYQTPYLLLHGDTLCTDDVGYQRMRKIFRNRLVQFVFLHLSRTRRIKIGDNMRASSKRHSSDKPQTIMDVNQDAVMSLMQTYPHITHMIHGHTHKPAMHRFMVDGEEKIRWVLGDWRPAAKIMKITAEGPEMVTFEITQSKR